MRQRIPRSFFAGPLAQWSELALKTSEMLTASAQVIGHRTGRMITCGPVPNSEDQLEFTLMGQEKIEAAAEAAAAMAFHAVEAQHKLLGSAMRQMLEGSSMMLSLISSTSAEQAAESQAKFMRAMTRSVIANSRLSATPASLVHHGLAPIHARATANAKRLGGK